MNGDRLWTPWRMAYIRQAADNGDSGGCIFCDLPVEQEDERNNLLARGRHTFVILNAFPYNPGHLMVAPYRHIADFEHLTDEELGETMRFTRLAVRALREDSGAHGFNLGMNLGTLAGAGIADHLHMHLVPRWGGDTNFMPVVGQTKVLPELLSETWHRLRPRFAEVERELRDHGGRPGGGPGPGDPGPG